MAEVRTRFAPSPTGYLHVGGLRTALYSFLLARKMGGKFLLRIEDTDQERSVPGAIENIIRTLEWAGITADEGPHCGGNCGPYIQSERLDLYKKYADQLVAQGDAYYCFCTEERLEKVRALQMAQKLPPAYDRHCRNLPTDEVKARLAAGEPHVIRMKIPLAGAITVDDLIRGKVSFSYSVVDDQVLIKSDGFPTYHLAVVVDDHFMNISHTIRGEEWLPSTPKHLLLYQYFKWEAPLFAHLPLLLNPDRSKLSKRQGDVAVEDYRAKGYLPEALINFIAFLGWNPGDTREIFTLDELIKEFSLERVGKSGAVFNVEKLQWLNHQHILRASHERLIAEIKPLLKARGFDIPADEFLIKLIDLLKDRAVTTHDFIEQGLFFFIAPSSYDETAKAKHWKPETPTHLNEFAAILANLEPFDAHAIEQALREYTKSKEVPAAALIHPLRLALTGIPTGPSLFHLMEVLGKRQSVSRINAIIK